MLRSTVYMQHNLLSTSTEWALAGSAATSSIILISTHFFTGWIFVFVAQGIIKMFKDVDVVFIGWIHYAAFDL